MSASLIVSLPSAERMVMCSGIMSLVLVSAMTGTGTVGVGTEWRWDLFRGLWRDTCVEGVVGKWDLSPPPMVAASFAFWRIFRFTLAALIISNMFCAMSSPSRFTTILLQKGLKVLVLVKLFQWSLGTRLEESEAGGLSLTAWLSLYESCSWGRRATFSSVTLRKFSSRESTDMLRSLMYISLKISCPSDSGGLKPFLLLGETLFLLVQVSSAALSSLEFSDLDLERILKAFFLFLAFSCLCRLFSFRADKEIFVTWGLSASVRVATLESSNELPRVELSDSVLTCFLLFSTWLLFLRILFLDLGCISLTMSPSAGSTSTSPHFPLTSIPMSSPPVSVCNPGATHSLDSSLKGDNAFFEAELVETEMPITESFLGVWVAALEFMYLDGGLMTKMARETLVPFSTSLIISAMGSTDTPLVTGGSVLPLTPSKPLLSFFLCAWTANLAGIGTLIFKSSSSSPFTCSLSCLENAYGSLRSSSPKMWHILL